MPEAAAGNINIVLSVNKANYTAAMQEAQRQLDVFAGKAKASGHATVSSMQASSAAIRELRNPLGNNQRAIEKFITTIPGVGNALRAAFPLVGGAAFAMMLVGIATKLADFIQKVQQMPQTIRDGFAALNLEQKTSIDSLNVLTDKLNAANALLEHKPGDNGTKLAIDEAKDSADKFAAACVAANGKVEDMLEKTKLGFSSLFLLKPTTTAVQESFEQYQRVQGGHAYDLSMADPNSQAAKDASNALSKTRSDYIGDRTRDLDTQNARGTNNGANIADDQGIITSLKNEGALELATQKNQSSQKANDALEAVKKAAEQAKAAAALRLEAQKKAMQDALDAMKADHEVSANEVALYWNRMVLSTKQGTDLYKFAIGKFGDANQELYRSQDEQTRKLDEDARKKAEILKRVDDMLIAAAATLDEQAEHMAAAQAKLDVANAKNVFELSALTRAHDLSTGAITRHDAAMAEAKDHAEEYKNELDALNKAKAALTQKDIDDGKGKDLDTQIANVTGQATRTAASDAYNTSNTTMGGEFKSAIGEFVAESRDAAKEMRELVTNTLANLNTQLVNGMMGQHTDFKSVGKTAFRSIATSALQKGEGSIMGLGKADGTSEAKALWVKMTTSGKSLGGIAASSTSKLGGVFGGLLKSIIPYMASGGYMDGPAIIGENGPELFNPGVSGYVTPNHKLGSAFSGDTHNWSIDARGSNDPAQTEAAVQRGIAAATPRIIAGSVQANREVKLRRPARG